MPSEPAESNFKNKVRTKAYPCVERNGVIWTYMGTRAEPPPLPGLPPNLDPTCTAIRRMHQCNYMQALEGDIDRLHAGYLHLGHLDACPDFLPGGSDYYGINERVSCSDQHGHGIDSSDA